MADDTRGAIPIDLKGALELARDAGNTAAAEVYEEALAGKIALADVRDTVIERELLAEGA